VLTTASVVVMYSSRMSSGRGGTRVGKDFRYCLSSTNSMEMKPHGKSLGV
jgi:hypothetical protein